MSGVCDCCEYVLVFQIGIIFEDFFKARTGADEFKDIGHANSHSTNARAPSALGRVEGYAIKII